MICCGRFCTFWPVSLQRQTLDMFLNAFSLLTVSQSHEPSHSEKLPKANHRRTSIKIELVIPSTALLFFLLSAFIDTALHQAWPFALTCRSLYQLSQDEEPDSKSCSRQWTQCFVQLHCLHWLSSAELQWSKQSSHALPQVVGEVLQRYGLAKAAESWSRWNLFECALRSLSLTWKNKRRASLVLFPFSETQVIQGLWAQRSYAVGGFWLECEACAQEESIWQNIKNRHEHIIKTYIHIHIHNYI